MSKVPAPHEKDSKAKVLYVDDSEMNLTLFQATFERDFEILLADSGEKGLEVIRNNDIAVIVSDQRMPGMSGTELLEIVSEEFPDTLRFILTAFTDYETVVESVNRGQIYGFFNKPFDADNVRQAINKAVEVYNLRKQSSVFMEQMEKANRELMAMDKSRTRFLHAITSELRVPIQKIMSALHMLKNKADSGELSELINFLDISVSKLENFTLTTRQLVELRSLETNLDRKKTSLNEILEICVIDKKSLLSERNFNLEIMRAEDDTITELNENYVLNALSILIERLSELMDDGGNLILRPGSGTKMNSVELEFQGPYSRKRFEDWTQFFSQPDRMQYESHLEQILIIEIMQAHNNGSVEFINSKDNTILARLNFPVMKDQV